LPCENLTAEFVAGQHCNAPQAASEPAKVTLSDVPQPEPCLDELDANSRLACFHRRFSAAAAIRSKSSGGITGTKGAFFLYGPRAAPL